MPTIKKKLVLATDLDGTFLGGLRHQKGELYSLFRENQKNLTLIYVTGRGLENIYPLLSDPIIPQPDYIIADVGATIVDGKNLEPIHPVFGDIQKKWPGATLILEELKDELQLANLQRQHVPQQRRCSFYAKRGQIPQKVYDVAQKYKLDVLYSADRYLDFLPQGVSKGTTLQKLIKLKKIDPQSVVIAGDTLNDLSLFQTDFHAIAVGNSEPDLVEAIEDKENTYLARAHGAKGILEGLQHFGFVDPKAKKKRAKVSYSKNEPSDQLVMVYHRLPFDEIKTKSGYKIDRHQSPNGIIPTLLRFFADGREGLWVAWSKSKNRKPNPAKQKLTADPKTYPHLELSRVWLDETDIQKFYQRFSKEAFWPILHSFTDKPQFNKDDWQHYVKVNELFSERILEKAKPNATIWIHDYNLWLVPGFLRRARPDLKIAFFHHTPFPSSDAFSIIPFRREILSSLIQCDYIGFHIPRYIENFVDCLRGHGPLEVLKTRPCAPRYLTHGLALGIPEHVKRIKAVENKLSLGAHPVGIDVNQIATILKKPTLQAKIKEIKKQAQGRKIILSIERLDYTKGPLEKLVVFEKLLEENPNLHEKIELYAIWTPPNPEMTIYQDIRSEVDQAVGRINGRFATYQWNPIRYFFQSFPYTEVLGYYAASDIAWVAPLRDGLNLVAKEYVATKGITKNPGVLILSEFAGAAAELGGALLTNPYDPDDMAYTLKRAIDLDEKTQALQMEGLFRTVSYYDIERWSKEFLNAVSKSFGDPKLDENGLTSWE